MKKVQYAVVYDTDGTTTARIPANGTTFTLAELQGFVGGYLASLIPANKQCKQLYADEEGLCKNLPLNPHTQVVCDTRVYNINGYSQHWRVRGPIVAVLTRSVDL